MGAVLICNSDAHRSEDALAAARDAKALAETWGLATVDPIDALPFAKRGAGSKA